jgi:hypothetical protein
VSRSTALADSATFGTDAYQAAVSSGVKRIVVTGVILPHRAVGPTEE